jgi:hypothetical protein
MKNAVNLFKMKATFSLETQETVCSATERYIPEYRITQLEA